jgi:hypothetical protein
LFLMKTHPVMSATFFCEHENTESAFLYALADSNAKCNSWLNSGQMK